MDIRVTKGCREVNIPKGAIARVVDLSPEPGGQCWVTLQFNRNVGYRKNTLIVKMVVRFGKWLDRPEGCNLNTGRPEHNIRVVKL